jgi:large subunit ribosomal protein L2
MRFFKFIYPFKFFKKNQSFFFSLKNKSGRNSTGTITVFSKGKKIKKKTLVKNIYQKLKNSIFVFVSVFRSQNKLFAFVKQINGLVSLVPFIKGVRVGDYTFTSLLPKNYWLFNKPGIIIFLKFLENFSLFSYLSLRQKPKFALSNGTFCQIYEIFTDFNLFRILLPSKQFKLVSGLNFIVLGRNSLSQYNKVVYAKAGSLKIFGKKSKVRGVARNPVDHPHGGRTKTNQPEKSIWGWVAKKNK